MKEFAVIGLGNFGATVVKELTKLKCKVTAIDSDKSKVQVMEDTAHLAIVAEATDRKFLENLGTQRYDCFVVSTGKDSHASILITLHLKELGANTIIVKANSPDHARILMKVGASEALIPEERVAVRLSHSLARPNLLDFLPLSEEFYVAELAAPESFIGKTLIELQLRTNYHVQIVATKDSVKGDLSFVPGGDYRVRVNDILIILGKGEDIEKIKG